MTNLESVEIMSNSTRKEDTRMRKHMTIVAAAALACVSNAPAQIPCLQQQKITASDADQGDWFGTSVSISGDTTIVGASFADCALGSTCGSAYVYRFDGNAWVEQQNLTPPDVAQSDAFGWAVAVSGDTVVVGAIGDYCPESGTRGSVHVFRFNGTSWVDEQKLIASDAAPFDGFGVSVAVSGDTVVVGAKSQDCEGMPSTSCGAVYVFRFDGTQWIEQQKLIASDTSNFDHFGSSVSLSGDTIVVGALHSDFIADIYYGAAYVYRFNGASWVEEQKLTASDASAQDQFGGSVSVSEDTVVVGARGDDCAAGIRCGSAYVYRFNGYFWLEKQKLTASDASFHDGFGGSVSVSGDRVVVGALLNNCTRGTSCGSAYLYQYNGTGWDELLKLRVTDLDNGDKFGTSVSMSGDRVLIGAPEDNCALGHGCGSAQIFDLMPGDTCEVCDVAGDPDDIEKDCNGNGQADRCDISNRVSADCNDDGIPDECEVVARGQFTLTAGPAVLSLHHNTVVVGTSEDNEKGERAGAAYIFRSTHRGWGLDRKLFAHDAQSGDRFGSSISKVYYSLLVGAPGDDERGPFAGAAYIFARDGDDWSEQAKITIPEGEVGEAFGMSVALAPGLAVISSRTPNSDSSSAVYVYRFDGSTWKFETKLVASDEHAQSMFGISLAANRDTIVVGATDSRDTKRGAVYIFSYKNDQWVEQTKLMGDVDLSRGSFGQAVAISGEVIVVGYPTDALFGTDRTAAYVYRLYRNQWLLESKLLASDSTMATYVGRSVALDGSRIFLGAQVGASDNPNGGVLIFHLEGDRWVQELVLHPSKDQPSTSFGSAVAMEGYTAFVTTSVDAEDQTHASMLSFGLGGPDCNGNGVLDSCDVTTGTSQDCTANGFLDECEADCNENGIADSCDILDGVENDCNVNGVPDSCDIQEEVEADCNGNARPDACDIASSVSVDCNDNEVPDECEVIAGGRFTLNTLPDILSMHGDIIAACSSGKDDRGHLRNAAVVFQSTNIGWGLDEILFAHDGSSHDRFCSSMAAHGNRILIGAPGDDVTGPSSGSAYIFERDNHGWSQQAKLILPEGEFGEDFGRAVALTENLAVIASRTPNIVPFGAVYVFRFDGLTWRFESKLVNNNENRAIAFGSALAVDQDTLVVGTATSRGSGPVYIFRFQHGQWIEQAILTAEMPHIRRRFGSAFALEDGVLLVGNATGTSGHNRGGGYVYRWQGNEWVLEAKLQASHKAGINLFGRSVAMDGDRILLGGLIWSREETKGVVLVYHRDGEDWVEERTIFSPVEIPSASFGSTIAISGHTAFIGSGVDLHGRNTPVLLSYGLGGPDCNENGVLDSCDVSTGSSQDCTVNGFLDECEADCNENGIADSCDIQDDVEQDCNQNAIPDFCDIARQESVDCNDNNVPDECEPDCNRNDIADACDIANGDSRDCDDDGVPDECAPDCNGNHQADNCDISFGISGDCNVNDIPDECEVIGVDPLTPMMHSKPPLFGADLAIERNVAFVGVPSSNPDAGGVVDVYRRDDGFWHRDDTLTLSEMQAGDSFGAAISIRRKFVIIGAPARGDESDGYGAAYIFKRQDRTWHDRAKLTATDGQMDDLFGADVAMGRRIAVVGAPDHDVSEKAMVGAAYIFTKHHDQWTQKAKLVPPDIYERSHFGVSVAVGEGIVVIGADGDAEAGYNAGAVYVFRKHGKRWEFDTKLLAFHGQDGDHFGRRVAVSGDRIAIGAPGSDISAPDGGAVYVYHRKSGTWKQEAVLVARDAQRGDELGGAVTIEREVVVAGISGAPDGNQSSGRVYVFRAAGDDWAQETIVAGTGVFSSGAVVTRIAMHRGTVLFGSDIVQSSSVIAGQVDVFRIGGSDCNDNDVLDFCDIFSGFSRDCDQNAIPDECERDCNNDGVPDPCAIDDGSAEDCNGNGIPDVCDIEKGRSIDCDDNLIPDECVLFRIDCNANSIPDTCDIDEGVSLDCDDNQVPDECQLFIDCNGNGLADFCDLSEMRSLDCDHNDIPDECQATVLDTLSPSDALSSDRFGVAIAVDGDVALIGADGHDSVRFNAGAAYVFRFDGATWQQTEKITADDAVVASAFGRAVSIKNDLAVVGAYKQILSGIQTGAVYVFRFDGLRWNEEAKLFPENVGDNARFGFAVDICADCTGGDTIIVGAMGDNGRGSESGAAYIFSNESGVWVEQAKLAGSADSFGLSVTMRENVAVIGSLGGFDRTGAVYVFNHDGSQWKRQTKLIPQEPKAGSIFGSSLDMEVGWLFVGAPRESDVHIQSGAVYAFRQIDSAWQQTARLTPLNPEAGNLFGSHIAANQDVLLVGAPGSDDGGEDAGAAYVYRFNGTEWIEETRIRDLHARSHDVFGVAVAVSDGIALIGSINHDGVAYQSGAVEAYLIGDGAIPGDGDTPCPCERMSASFFTKPKFGVGDYPLSVATGDLDGDGFPDDCDQCPESDTTETIVINGCDSGVINEFLEDGCNMMDRLKECNKTSYHNGSYVRCVKQFSRRWSKQGLISKNDAGLITHCAAQNSQEKRRNGVTRGR